MKITEVLQDMKISGWLVTACPKAKPEKLSLFLPSDIGADASSPLPILRYIGADLKLPVTLNV